MPAGVLGLANYFRSLIHKYSDIISCILWWSALKCYLKFKWNEEAEKAFCSIQENIMKNSILKPADFSEELFFICDVSKVAISAILAQKQNENLVPIEFFGRKLRDPEKRYPSVKFEILAVHEAVQHFKYILWGRKFTIQTNSKSNTQHLHLENQSDIVKRWMADLAECNYEFEYIGKFNPADYVYF